MSNVAAIADKDFLSGYYKDYCYPYFKGPKVAPKLIIKMKRFIQEPISK